MEFSVSKKKKSRILGSTARPVLQARSTHPSLAGQPLVLSARACQMRVFPAGTKTWDDAAELVAPRWLTVSAQPTSGIAEPAGEALVRAGGGRVHDGVGAHVLDVLVWESSRMGCQRWSLKLP